jgi:hypothetical protein
MNRPVILHRGVAPIPLEHMARHDPDAVFARRDPIQDIRDRLNGKQRHYRIEPSKLEWSFVCLVYAAICFAVVAF